ASESTALERTGTTSRWARATDTGSGATQSASSSDGSGRISGCLSMSYASGITTRGPLGNGLTGANIGRFGWIGLIAPLSFQIRNRPHRPATHRGAHTQIASLRLGRQESSKNPSTAAFLIFLPRLPLLAEELPYVVACQALAHLCVWIVFIHH